MLGICASIQIKLSCLSFVFHNSRKAKSKNLVKRDARWTLVFHDWSDNKFETSLLGAKVTFLTMDSEQCCIILRENGIMTFKLRSFLCY